MWPLLGVGVVVVGFLLRFNPLLVIAAAVFVSGWAGHLSLYDTVAALGHAFNQSRLVSIQLLVLPVIGLLEREGLKERARILIGKVHAATTGRLLLVYLFARQVTIAFGLPIGGQAQMVRPLVAPMAEAAEETQGGPLDAPTRELIRAHAAAADNVGAFFGEDIFIAIGSIMLIKGMLDQAGVIVQPLELSVWAIPTAILAFLIHGTRLLLLDRRLAARR
ncbi:MAG TPA: DUF969 domain-containing protein [Rhizomicrobium sp.]|nr:DUF969 domain-containing protein [Rhizomicrobium sp.]